MLAFEIIFNFSIQTKHFITKKFKFFQKMNCFIKILYRNTLLAYSVKLGSLHISLNLRPSNIHKLHELNWIPIH